MRTQERIKCTSPVLFNCFLHYLLALTIRELQLGEMHPDTANSLGNLAVLYQRQGKYAEAEMLGRRALAICEQLLGAEHPITRNIRANYIALLEAMKSEEVVDS